MLFVVCYCVFVVCRVECVLLVVSLFTTKSLRLCCVVVRCLLVFACVCLCVIRVVLVCCCGLVFVCVSRVLVVVCGLLLCGLLFVV